MWEKGKPRPIPPDDQRCIRIRKDGTRCKKFKCHDTTVCYSHGGTAPQIKRKQAKLEAQRKVVRDQQSVINQMGGALKRRGIDMDPAEHMVSALYEATGMVELFGAYVLRLDAESQEKANGGVRGLLKYAAPADELDALQVSTDEMLITLNRHGEAQIHPFVEQFNHWHDKRFQYAERCVKAGIAERKVRLAEEQGAILVRIIRAHDRDLERKFGVTILADPEYPAMMRRHLSLGATSDVIESTAA